MSGATASWSAAILSPLSFLVTATPERSQNLGAQEEHHSAASIA